MSRRTPRSYLAWVWLVWAGTLWWCLPAWAEKENISCSSTEPWWVVSNQGHVNRNQLTASPSGVLSWRFQRTKTEPFALGSTASLTGFSSLQFDVCSDETTNLVLALDDREGAKFHFLFPVTAKTWKHVEVTPALFQPSDDSPIKKARLDCDQIGGGFGLVDFGCLLDKRTPNTLQIKAVVIDRSDLPPAQIPPEINGISVDVTNPGALTHDLTIRGGGKLRISAAKFRLASNIVLEDGTLEFAQTNLAIDSRFPHDRQIRVLGHSLLRLSDCSVSSSYQVGCNLLGAARLEVASTHFTTSNLTVGTTAGTSIVLESARSPGEFILPPGTSMKISNSQGVLLWPVFMSENHCSVSFPDGAKVDRFVMPPAAQIQLVITNSTGILWGTIAQSGCDLTIKASKLLALGLQFTGGAQGTLNRLVNNQPITALKLVLPDRKLSLVDSSVKTWNVYASNSSDVSLEDCVIGEAMTFDRGRMNLSRTTIDGTGGYVASSDDSRLQLSRCTLQCPAVAKDRSTLVLQQCKVIGDVTASGSGKVELPSTSLTGVTKALERGQIFR